MIQLDLRYVNAKFFVNRLLEISVKFLQLQVKVQMMWLKKKES